MTNEDLDFNTVFSLYLNKKFADETGEKKETQLR